MLPTLGKLLEKCIVQRINEITEPKLHPRQYGFCKGEARRTAF